MAARTAELDEARQQLTVLQVGLQTHMVMAGDGIAGGALPTFCLVPPWGASSHNTASIRLRRLNMVHKGR